MPQNNNRYAKQAGNTNRNKSKSSTKSRASKKKSKKAQNVIVVILVVIIISIATFLTVGGIRVYKAIATPKKNVDDIELTSHIKTPEEYSDKVSYYVLGLLGKKIEDPTEMLSILCWDKKNKTVSILGLPQDTYLGESGQWTVKRIADVWGNPKPLDWCISCRRSVKVNEIKDKKHTVCDTKLTQMTGSSSEDLCGIFNNLLGLPVDGYFLFQQESLVKLVDLLGGLDVNLESPISVDDVDYKKGIQTIDGSASLYYATYRKSGINGDIDRLVRQRKVFIALFQRLVRHSEKSLLNDYIGPLMNGSTPLKTDFYREKICKLISEMNGIEPPAFTAYVLPGKTGRAGGKTYFAPHKPTLLKLLNESFNPYGNALTEADLKLTELGSGKVYDMHKQVLSEIAVPQSGAIKTETTKKAS